jgi:hypothetical protein
MPAPAHQYCDNRSVSAESHSTTLHGPQLDADRGRAGQDRQCPPFDGKSHCNQTPASTVPWMMLRRNIDIMAT